MNLKEICSTLFARSLSAEHLAASTSYSPDAGALADQCTSVRGRAFGFSDYGSVPRDPERTEEYWSTRVGTGDDLYRLQDFAIGDHAISRVGTHLSRVLAEP